MNSWKRLLGYLKPYRFQLGVALVAMFALAVTTSLYPVVIDLISTSLFGGSEAINQIVGSKLERIQDALSYLGIQTSAAELKSSLGKNLLFALAFVVIIKAMSQAVRFYVMGAIAQRVVADIRKILFDAITRQSQAFFGEQGSGFLVSRVINDVAQVERAATYAIPVLIGDVLKVVGLATICLWQYSDLALVSVVVLPLATFPIVRFGKMLKKYAKESQQKLGSITNRVAETLGGVRIVQIYGREEYEINRFDNESENYVRIMMRSVLVRAIQTPIMELIGIFALVLTMLYARWKIDSGAIRPGEVIAFLMAIILMYEPLKAIGRLNGIIMPGLAAAERVFEIIDRPPQVTDDASAVPLPRMSNEVEFRNVSFRYPNSDAYAVRDVNLTLQRGRLIALVGASGSGKSTIASLLPRLYNVTEGEIVLDGIPIESGTVASLRNQIAVVTQETYLFNDSIRDNIAYGVPGASDAEIEEAARAAFAHDFIIKLPDGYQTMPGERGVTLSGGQRQRIAIARAFLRDAPILILDEATSALDVESEEEVQRALEALITNRTTLVIAHRLSTIQDADEIIVMEEGCVVERGTHQHLLNLAGTYARLMALSEV
ncbi:MAG: ABC transporter transmembrane domain-containing protein [Myxococcota bacterium]|nr:ABC transporter transmembrane domain-containing protein [Myxococcota bacterium]